MMSYKERAAAQQVARDRYNELVAADETARNGKSYHVDGALRYWNENTYTTYALPPSYSTYITVHSLSPNTLWYSDDEHAPYRAPAPSSLPDGVQSEQLCFRGQQLLDAAVAVDSLAHPDLGPFEKFYAVDVDRIPFPHDLENRRCYNCDKPVEELGRIFCHIKLPNTNIPIPLFECGLNCRSFSLRYDSTDKKCKGNQNEAAVFNYGASMLYSKKLIKRVSCFCCRRVCERQYAGEKEPDNWGQFVESRSVFMRALPLGHNHAQIVEAILRGETPIQRHAPTSKWICDDCMSAVCTIECNADHPLWAAATALVRELVDADDWLSAPKTPGDKRPADADEMAVPVAKKTAVNATD